MASHGARRRGCERIEGKKFLGTNTGLGLVAVDVLRTTTTYTP